MRIISLCLALALLTGVDGAYAQGSGGRATSLEQALSAAHHHWRATLLTGDPDSIADAFTGDLIAIEGGVADILGNEAVRSRVAEVFTSREMRMLDITPVTLAAKFVSDSVISEAGVYVEKLQVGGGEPFTITSHYVAVWRLDRDGVWRIQRIAQHIK